MAVDPSTYEKFIQAEQRAKDLGLSLIEVLDRAGVLLTSKRKHDIEIEVIRDLERRLEVQAPHKLMSFYCGKPTGTSAEMFSAVQQWVETIAQARVSGTLEDM